MKNIFIITDWAGNRIFPNKEFETFEDAWDFIYEEFPDEDDLSDFYVIVV